MNDAATVAANTPRATGDGATLPVPGWLALAVTLVVALGALAGIHRALLPTDGWQTRVPDGRDGQIVFARNIAGLPSALRPGDILLAIDGHAFDDLQRRALAGQARPPAGWRDGGAATYDVLRDGAPVRVTVPLASRPAALLLPHSTAAIIGLGIRLALLAGSLLVVLRRPRERAARLLFLFAILLTVGAGEARPADLLSNSAYWSVWAFEDLKWMLVIGPILTDLVASFPAALPPVRRWPLGSRVGIYAALPVAFLATLAVSDDWRDAFWPVYERVNLAGILVFLAVAVLGLTHALGAPADPVTRQQTRWVLLGLGVGLGGAIAIYAIEAWLVGHSTAGDALIGVVLLALPLSLAVAILRYQLWNLDLVLNRALVHGALTAILIALYAAIVRGGGDALGASGEGWLSLAAAGAVAVAFAPLRDRLQRGVNRLMYGTRDEPSAVVAHLGRRLEGTLPPGEVLPTLVATIAAALKLPYVAIELAAGEASIVAAQTGVRDERALRLPLLQRGERIGSLVVGPRPGEPALSARDRRLLETLTAQVGTAADAVRLASDLQRSRERLVTAREEERRRLRRDLHDDLGPMLAGFTLQVGAIRNLLGHDNDAADRLLAEMGDEAETAVERVRRLVYGLRPPALDELGLAGALRARAGQQAGEIAVTVEVPPDLPSLPAAVEVAAYRMCQEALANVVRHAGATRCAIRLTLEDGALRVEITDDGAGLPAEHHIGVGLHAMRERAEELGGACIIASAPGGGTRVTARLPLPEEG